MYLTPSYFCIHSGLQGLLCSVILVKEWCCLECEVLRQKSRAMWIKPWVLPHTPFDWAREHSPSVAACQQYGVDSEGNHLIFSNDILPVCLWPGSQLLPKAWLVPCSCALCPPAVFLHLSAAGSRHLGIFAHILLWSILIPWGPWLPPVLV